MITLITGENTYENERTLRTLVANSNATAERIDGETLAGAQLPDLFMGATLFASERLIVIKNLSNNKMVWNELETWLERANNETHLVFVETKPDKRTKTYKLLQKYAEVHESKLWTERDSSKVEQWVFGESKARGKELDKKSAHALVARVGVDQWLLSQALEKLVVLETVTPEVVAETIEANPSENVFDLFETALKGDVERLKTIIDTLKTSEDPYRLFGLLTSQVMQFAALAFADKPSAEVAKDIGAHPFALSKLSKYANDANAKVRAKIILAACTRADERMKSTGGDPWQFLEEALFKIAASK